MVVELSCATLVIDAISKEAGSGTIRSLDSDQPMLSRIGCRQELLHTASYEFHNSSIGLRRPC